MYPWRAARRGQPGSRTVLSPCPLWLVGGVQPVHPTVVGQKFEPASKRERRIDHNPVSQWWQPGRKYAHLQPARKAEQYRHMAQRIDRNMAEHTVQRVTARRGRVCRLGETIRSILTDSKDI